MPRHRRLPLETLQPFLLDAPPPRGPYPPSSATTPFDWHTIFGNDHPVELEVGFGKGLFLLAESLARPEVNYVGVEIERNYVLFTANRLAKEDRRNVRLAASDARWYLQAKVRERSLQAIHIYFPDPWWKQRHKKRKLLTEEFLKTCARALSPGGTLNVATDVQDYFTATQELLQRLEEFRSLPPPPPHGPAHYLTNFERKYRQEGRLVYRACYEKI